MTEEREVPVNAQTIQSKSEQDPRLVGLYREVERLSFVTARAIPLLTHYERKAFHPMVRCSDSDYEELLVAGDLVAAIELKVREKSYSTLTVVFDPHRFRSFCGCSSIPSFD